MTNFEKLVDANLFSNVYFFYFRIQINPTCGMHVLQGLSRGIHFLILALKVLSLSESIISFGKVSKIFGSKKETDSVPYIIGFTPLLFRKIILRKL